MICDLSFRPSSYSVSSLSLHPLFSELLPLFRFFLHRVSLITSALPFSSIRLWVSTLLCSVSLRYFPGVWSIPTLASSFHWFYRLNCQLFLGIVYFNRRQWLEKNELNTRGRKINDVLLLRSLPFLIMLTDLVCFLWKSCFAILNFI